LLDNRDGEGLRNKAQDIAEQIKEQKMSAVSFDIILYPFVKKYLEKFIDRSVIYHTWDLSNPIARPNFKEVMEGKSYYNDKKVKTIIVRYSSKLGL
jgi:hypothetical protein